MKKLALVSLIVLTGCGTILDPSKTSSYPLDDGPMKNWISTEYPDSNDFTVDQSDDNPDVVRWTTPIGECAGMVNGIYRGDNPKRFIAPIICMDQPGTDR